MHTLGVLALTCTPTASPHLLLQVVTLENVAMYLAVVNPNPNPNPNPDQVTLENVAVDLEATAVTVALTLALYP